MKTKIIERKARYYLAPRRCLNCSIVIPFERRNNPKFCTRKCSGLYAWTVPNSKLKASNCGGRKMSEATKEKMSRSKLNAPHKISGGRCKWYPFEGQKLQGSWELAIAMKFSANNIRWTKLGVNRGHFLYVMDGVKRDYTPDFFLPDLDLYVEIKGYWWGRDREKMNIVMASNPTKKIVLIEKDDYKKIMGNEVSIIEFIHT